MSNDEGVVVASEDDDAPLERELARFRFYPASTSDRQDAHQRVRNICAGRRTVQAAIGYR